MHGNFIVDKSTFLAVEHVMDRTVMIVKLTCDAKIIEVNKLFLEKIQYTADELIMSDYWNLVNEKKADWQGIWNEIQQGRQWNSVSCLITKYGELKWFELTFIPVYTNGALQQVILLHVDITDQKNAEQWRQLAFRHELTQLPNRRKFLLSIDEHIYRAEEDGTKFAVLFLDVNQLKMVNDNYGHTIGDLLLIEVGRRISQLPHLDECVFHVSGDEFIILLKDPGLLDYVLKSIEVQFDKSFELKGHSIDVSVSIGSSMYPDDSMNARRLIELADDAMYKAKAKVAHTKQRYKNGIFANEGKTK